MLTLIAKFRATGLYADARKLANYDAKHPMSSCLLSSEDHATLALALAMVRSVRAA